MNIKCAQPRQIVDVILLDLQECDIGIEWDIACDDLQHQKAKERESGQCEVFYNDA